MHPFWALLSCIVSCLAFRKSQQEGIFKVCPNRRLKSAQNVLLTFSVSSELECARACGKYEECLSANVALQTVGYVCELMSDMADNCNSLDEDSEANFITLAFPKCVNGGVWNTGNQNCGTCNIGFAGIFCERRIIDCAEGASNGQIGSEEVLVHPVSSLQPFPVMCNFNSKLTFIERRGFCGHFGNFNQTWLAYKQGFGDINCNYFIGLEKLYLLTNQRETKLKVMVVSTTSVQHTALYRDFRIENETANYAMHYTSFVSNPTNEAGDGFGLGAPSASINHARFCTPDRDCDSCARNSSSGWWFNTNCAVINMNMPSDGNSLQWPKNTSDTTLVTIKQFRLALQPAV